MNFTNQPAPGRLPFSRWWPVFAGALCGVVMRLIFWGSPDFPWDAMHGAFIGLVPLAVGAVTVYVAERSARRDWGYYVLAGVIANVLFVMATMLILIEGLICAILILPLFCGLGMVGALIMGVVCRRSDWPRKPSMYGFMMMPLLFAGAAPDSTGPAYFGAIERTIIVNADAPAVWRQLLDTRDIQEAEVEHGWMFRIGVPAPLAGVTRLTPQGLVRDVRMGKGIHFTQHATQWETNRYVKWNYRFSADSFPPGALDDHVTIGGDFFDLIDTEYVLTPMGPGSTALTVRMHYRVSTQFNWYAIPLAHMLIGNFEEVVLDLYRGRAT